MKKIVFFVKIAVLRLTGVFVCGCLLAVSCVLWLALYSWASLYKYCARVCHCKKAQNQVLNNLQASIANMFDNFKA